MKFSLLRRRHIPERQADLMFAVVATLLSLRFVLRIWPWLHFESGDIHFWFQPWYDHIIQYGRLHSLESSFANYNPPYVYLLSFFSLLNRWVSSTVIFKLMEWPFILFNAFLFWDICRALHCSKRRALLAAWIALVTPEIVANGLQWGQSDNLYTTFVLLFLRFMIARRPGFALAAIGIAFSLKLQTIFLGPVVLALILTGEVPVWSLLAAIASYIVMMVPAAVAGRPWRELLLVYKQQAGLYQAIGMLAANPYEFLLPYAERSERLNNLIVHLGILVAAIASAVLVWFLVKSKRLHDKRMLLLASASSMLLEPYLLPKMHDRYLFPGDILAVLLAVLMPSSFAIPACMLQIGAFLAYYPFLHGKMYEPRRFWVLPVALVTAALWLIGKHLYELGRTGELALETAEPEPANGY